MDKYLTIINGNEEKVAVLYAGDVKNCRIEKDIAGMDSLSFDIYKTNDNGLKYDYVQKGYNILVKELTYEQIYKITKITIKRENGGIVKKATCDHISYDFITYPLDSFSFDGNLSSYMQENWSPYGYTYHIETDRHIVLEYKNKTNTRQVFLDAIKQSGQDFYIFGKHVKIGNNWSNWNGVYFSVGKNVKSIDSEIDQDDNVSYRLNIWELESTIDFKGTLLENIESLDIYDTVLVDDEDMELNQQKLKILRYEYDYFNKTNSTIELSNRRLNYTDIVVDSKNMNNMDASTMKFDKVDLKSLGDKKLLDLDDFKISDYNLDLGKPLGIGTDGVVALDSIGNADHADTSDTATNATHAINSDYSTLAGKSNSTYRLIDGPESDLEADDYILNWVAFMLRLTMDSTVLSNISYSSGSKGIELMFNSPTVDGVAMGFCDDLNMAQHDGYEFFLGKDGVIFNWGNGTGGTDNKHASLGLGAWGQLSSGNATMIAMAGDGETPLGCQTYMGTTYSNPTAGWHLSELKMYGTGRIQLSNEQGAMMELDTDGNINFTVPTGKNVFVNGRAVVLS